ncbi:MAG: hypothetical protein U0172_05140 [Nitrospiraceae bacterium]
MSSARKIVDDLRAGLRALRQGTAEVTDRAIEETALVRVRLKIRQLDQQLEQIYEELGERAVLRRDKGETVDQLLREPDVMTLVVQAHDVRQEREQLLAEIQDIRSAS